jgi:hypothetical protein
MAFVCYRYGRKCLQILVSPMPVNGLIDILYRTRNANTDLS